MSGSNVRDVRDTLREPLARLALSALFGFEYTGDSLCEEAERILSKPNPRAVRAVGFADAALDRVEHELLVVNEPAPLELREVLRKEIRCAWFAGRETRGAQYDSEAVEAGWDRQLDALFAALSQTLPAPGEVKAGARNMYLLQGDNSRMAEALRHCRDQFAFYAREHYALGKSEKGDTNTRFADLANNALTAIKPAFPSLATVAAANDEGVQKAALSFAAAIQPHLETLDLHNCSIGAARECIVGEFTAAIRLLSQGGGK